MRAFRLLLRHSLLYWRRNPFLGDGTLAGQIVITVLAAALVGVFVVGPLVLGGLFWSRIVAEVPVLTGEPLPALNRSLLPALLALLPMRFLLHQPSSLSIRPYAARPLSRSGLVHAHLALSLASLFNVGALAFLVPVWTSTVWPALPPVAALLWALAAGAGVVLWNYGAALLHLWLGRRSPWLWGVGALAGATLAGDYLLGTRVVPALSGAVLSRPLAGAVLLCSAAAALHGQLHRAYMDGLRDAPPGTGRPWALADRLVAWLERFGDAGRVAALEFRMALRHRRSRGALLLVFLSGPYFGLTAAWGADPSGFLGLCIYSVGGASLMYGQFLFAADAKHLSGLLARALPVRALIGGKLLMVQLLTAATFLWTSPVLAWIPGYLRWTYLAALLFFIGVGAPLLIMLSMNTRQPIDLTRSVFSFRAGRSLHLLGMLFALFYFMVVLVVVIETEQVAWAGFLVVPALGPLAVQPWLTRALTRRFLRKRHVLLDRLRTNEPV